MRSKNASLKMLLLLLAVCVGCGSPDFYKLSGTVTKDGKPLPFLQVTLAPDDLDSTRPPMCITDKDGNFEMTCGREYGVPPGIYTVHMEDPAFVDGGKTPKKTDPFFEDYEYVCLRYSTQNSDLKYEADQHRKNFELKADTKEPAKPLIPLKAIKNTTDVP